MTTMQSSPMNLRIGQHIAQALPLGNPTPQPFSCELAGIGAANDGASLTDSFVTFSLWELLFIRFRLHLCESHEQMVMPGSHQSIVAKFECIPLMHPSSVRLSCPSSGISRGDPAGLCRLSQLSITPFSQH